MAIEATLTKRIYQANGDTREWPVPFAYSRTVDIRLMYTDVDNHEMEITSNFRVNVNESGNTSVTFPVTGKPLPFGVKLTVYRATPLTQIIDLIYGGAFSPDVLEKDGFDRAIMMIQEIDEQVRRSIKIPISSSEKSDTLLENIFDARDKAKNSAELAKAWSVGRNDPLTVPEKSSRENAFISQAYAEANEDVPVSDFLSGGHNLQPNVGWNQTGTQNDIVEYSAKHHSFKARKSAETATQEAVTALAGATRAEAAAHQTEADIEGLLQTINTTGQVNVDRVNEAGQTQVERIESMVSVDAGPGKIPAANKDGKLHKDWIPLGAGTFVGTISLLPFRYTELPAGWYFCNGARYKTQSSPQGIVLKALSSSFKLDWSMTLSGSGASETINLPNLFHSDGRGFVLRTVNGSARQVGNVEIDALQQMTGNLYGVLTSVEKVSGAFSLSRIGGGNIGPGGGGLNESLTFSASGSARTSTETRPLNIGMTPAIFLGV